MNKVLVIACHPDDEVLGCGGTISRFIHEGKAVRVLILTDCLAPRKTDAERAELRLATIEAGMVLGLTDIVFADIGFAEKKRFDELPFKEIILPIEKQIDEYKPDIVFTHHRGDLNTDHQIAFKATIAACRTFRPHRVSKILCYEVPSSTEQAPAFPEYSFQPNVFVDISNYLEQKIESLGCYTQELNQFPHPRSLENVSNVAKVWGSKCGTNAVEAFELVRELI